jgi:Lon-like protease
MTQPTVTTAPPPPALPPRRRRRWWHVVGVVALSALAAAVVAASFVHVPYVIISPGDATALDTRVVTVAGARAYPHRGDFLYLTVRVSNHDPTVWRWLFAQLDGDVSVVKRQDVIGCASYGDSSRLNDLLMRQSQVTAKTVALEHLGYQVVPTSQRAVIVDVLCDGPAEGQLAPGDTVVAVDGHSVASADAVRPLIEAHRPGSDVKLTVDRDGKNRSVTVRAGRRTADPNHPCTVASGSPSAANQQACVGVATQNISSVQFPVNIHINTQRVSGPSAGLAFTLAIIDDLTPGDLTGGHHVAVTGTIAPDGSVGPVGGVEQKTITARENGATLMLVPVLEAKAAREHAEGMRVVAVKNIDDALRALRRAGGDPLPNERAPTNGT